MPQEVPLTDTELIELAGLVEELQDKIIDSYYNYKNSLLLLKDTRARLLLYNKNYSKMAKGLAVGLNKGHVVSKIEKPSRVKVQRRKSII